MLAAPLHSSFFQTTTIPESRVDKYPKAQYYSLLALDLNTHRILEVRVVTILALFETMAKIVRSSGIEFDMFCSVLC
jgi:hypothetical protein